MARPRTPDRLTRDMFEVPQPQPPQAAGHRLQVCHLVSQMLKDCRHPDRYAVAADMSRQSGRDFSKLMLDAWSAESREDHNVPFYAVPALEAACDSTALTMWLVAVRGGRALFGRDVLNAERGKLEAIKRDIAGRIRELDRIMGADA